MKLKKMCLFLVLFVMFSLDAYAEMQAKMYQEKAGYMRATITLGFSKDKHTTLTETLVWDDWGLKVAKYQVDESGRGTKTVIRLVEENGDTGKVIIGSAFLVDLPLGTHKETPYPARKVLSQLRAEERTDMAMAFVRKFGIFTETSEKKEVAERPCTVWRSKMNDAHTNCFWQGIILETKMRMDGSDYRHDKKAFEIKIEDVDSTHFEIPGRLKP